MIAQRRLAKAGLVAALLAAVLGLGTVVYGEMTFEAVEATPDVAVAQKSEPALPEPGYALPPLRNFAEVVARPLFSRTRKPPPQQASPEAIRQSSSLALSGVILSKSDRVALIQHGKPPVLTHVPEGQEIEGWTLVEIQPDHIVLQRGATRQELKLVDKPVWPSPNGPLPGVPAKP